MHERDGFRKNLKRNRPNPTEEDYLDGQNKSFFSKRRCKTSKDAFTTKKVFSNEGVYVRDLKGYSEDAKAYKNGSKVNIS